VYNRDMSTTMITKTTSRDILARLLASENITVVRDSRAETATFNVETRVLTLPVWYDISDDLGDMLIGHEVSHALHTPAGAEALNRAAAIVSGHDQDAEIDDSIFMVAKDYLNVVEDARIDRLIQDRFPGLVRNYRKGYREMFERNFFATNDKNSEDFGFLDRINLHFKVGNHFPVSFDKVEQVFIDRIDAATTWDEVVEISRDLWVHCTENPRQDSSPQPSEGSVGSDSDDGSSAESTETRDSGASMTDDTDDGSSAESTETSSSMENQSEDAGSQPQTPEGSSTNRHNQSRLAQAAEYSPKVNEKVMPTTHLDRCVISTTEVLKDWQNSFTDEEAAIATKTFVRANRRIIDSMVKAFTMNQAAAVAKRSKIAKTGEIDTLRIVNHRLSEDIFRRNTILPKGKSHGVVLFLDWSGSMQDIAPDTIHQMLIMAHFCRRVNIPFEAYLFTDSYSRRYSFDKPADRNGFPWDAPNPGEFDLQDDILNLLNIVNTRANNADWNRLNAAAISLARALLNQTRWNADLPNWISPCSARTTPSGWGLGGTPLDAAIIAGRDLVKDFRKRTGIERLHTIFVTDGQSSPSGVHRRGGMVTIREKCDAWKIDGQLRGMYLADGMVHASIYTHHLLAWFRDTTESGVHGIYLTDRHNHNKTRSPKKFSETGVASFRNDGSYGRFLVMNPKTPRTTANTDINTASTVRGAATALIRSNKVERRLRTMMEMIATIIAAERF